MRWSFEAFVLIGDLTRDCADLAERLSMSTGGDGPFDSWPAIVARVHELTDEHRERIADLPARGSRWSRPVPIVDPGASSAVAIRRPPPRRASPGVSGSNRYHHAEGQGVQEASWSPIARKQPVPYGRKLTPPLDPGVAAVLGDRGPATHCQLPSYGRAEFPSEAPATTPPETRAPKADACA